MKKTTASAFAAFVCFSCVPVEVAEPIPEVLDPPMPEVVGLEPALDLNPDPKVVEYELTAGTTSHELTSGRPRLVYAYNGQLPGPLLQARVGDTVRVHFTNELEEPTTIHWHGLRIDVAMDGVVHGNVLAVQPGESFTYEFVVPDAGTFWYHPHVRATEQVERGLFGMLIVHEADDAAPAVDTDRAFVLDDVRVRGDGNIASFNTTGMDVMHGRTGNVLHVNGSDQILPVEMGEGEVARWRLVNTANARTMVVRFPGLSVKEIGSDGGLWPQRLVREVDEIVLPVGARAELEVRMNGASASMDSIVLALDANDQIIEVPVPLVSVTHDAARDVAEPLAGHIADPAFVQLPPDLQITKRLVFSGINTPTGLKMTINGFTMENAPMWEVRQGELQVIELVNMIGPEHPFHLHGQFFQVLQRQGRLATDIGVRDTALIGGMQTVIVATSFDNPGDWMYHCHILEHAEAGMMAMVRVLPE